VPPSSSRSASFGPPSGISRSCLRSPSVSYGRSTAQPAARSKTTTTKTTTKPTTTTNETPDLHELVLAALAAEGIKPKVKWAPSRNYCSFYVGKANIGYVFRQTRTGIRIEPAAAAADLPKAVKGFKSGTRSARFALVGVVSDAAGIVRCLGRSGGRPLS
jgi:hypothetical protein